MIPHVKTKLIFIAKKQNIFFEIKTQKQKMSFLNSTNILFTILEQFLQFKACTS